MINDFETIHDTNITARDDIKPPNFTRNSFLESCKMVRFKHIQVPTRQPNKKPAMESLNTR